MANSYKDIIITPNRSNTADPKIEFRGANTTVNTAITIQTYPTSNGTLSFEGAAGQLFSITNDLSGSIFSVNDVSGIPSIEVFANGQINLAEYGGRIVVGNTATFVANTFNATDITVAGNLTVSGTTTYINTTTLNVGDNIITLNADLPGATAPTENAGIDINRGSSANVQFIWDETNDRWSTVSQPLATGNVTIAGFANATGSIQGGSTLTIAGAASGITTLAAGNTTITGFANVTGTIQGGSSLTIAGAASGITTLAAGNTTITGFANVTSTIQGGAGLTIAGAASGITTLAAGNTTLTGFINVSSTANVGGTTNLRSTLQVNGAVTIANTLGTGNTTITGFANVTSTIQGGSSLTIAGAASGITTLAAGNTTITGFANVTGTIQGGAGLTLAGAVSGITTLAAGNTTITGFVNTSVSVNSALFTIGSSLIANTTGVYHTGVINAASFTAGTGFIANSSSVNTPNVTIKTGAQVGNYITSAASGNDLLNVRGGNYTHAINFYDSFPGTNATPYANLAGGYQNQSRLVLSGFNAANVNNLTSTYGSDLISVANGSFNANTTGAYPASNTVGNALGNTISRWALTATTGVFAGAVSGITTLAAGNTTITGFANVTSTLQVGTNTATFGTAAYIVANGNVGIGTASPGRKLVISGDGITIDNGTSSAVVEMYSTTDYRLQATADWQIFDVTNNSSRFYITAAGDIGIGTTGPGTKLDVLGTGRFQASGDVQLYLNGNGTSWAGINFTDSSNNDNIYYNGQNSTFAIGGGGSNIANKKLHINGGVTIGSGLAATAIDANSLIIEGSLGFGSSTRQMINLWSTTYGIGIQSSTQYFRSASRFSWHRGGVHSDTENDAGSGGTNAMTLDSSSNLIVSGSVRSPIFYDSGNTSFYLDPQGGSVLGGVVSFAGGTNINSNGDVYARRDAGTTGVYYFATGVDKYLYWDGGKYIFGGGGYVESSISFRAPIFYDTANTSYYADPQGTSRLGALSLDTIPVTAGVTSLTTAPIQLAGTYNIGSTSTWMPMTHQRAVYTDGYVTHLNTGLYKQNSTWGPGGSGWYAAIGGSDTNPTEAWYLTYGGVINHSQGYVTTANSFRAPVFYDSANTSFYVDPASTSVLSVVRADTIQRNGGNQAILLNNTTYTQMCDPQGVVKFWIGGTADAGNYYNNSTHYFRNTADAVQFQIGGNAARKAAYNSSDGMLSIYGDSGGWAMGTYYFGSSGTNLGGFGAYGGGNVLNNFWIGTSYSSPSLEVYTDGRSIAAGSFRAPIFYDTANTSFYADPAGTSSFNQVLLQDAGAIIFNDRGRDVNTVTLPNWNTRSIRWDFVSASSAGTGGNYAGVMSFTPWAGTTASTGDASYQLVFGGTAVNGGGVPQMRIRKGIDTTWNSFYNIHHDGYADMYATNSFRAPIFYDSDDTSVRWDAGIFVLRSTSPTMYFRDTDQNSAMLHNNSNLFYILRGGNDTETWTQVGGYWPVYWNLTNNDATFGGAIWAAGNITAYSDAKLKENVETIDSALEKTLKLRGVYYNLIRDETKTRKLGVIAQEVQEVLPEVVMLHQDKEDEEGTLSVDYGNIVGLLIEAIKEQQTQINKLEQQINSIRGL